MSRLTNKKLDMLIDLYQDKYIENALDYNVSLAVKELKEYRDLEEQGLLLKLPVTIGQEVYKINNNLIIPMFVNEIVYTLLYKGTKSRLLIRTVENKHYRHNYYFLENIGKEVFLTKEEAEQELKRLENKDE